MKVFADFHHSALMHSLVLLFEKRLGGTVYRPIGKEWHERGFWHVYEHPATVEQFLSLDQGYRPVDGTPPLNQILAGAVDEGEGVFYCLDPEHESFNRAITFDRFCQEKFDIIICSIPEHIEPFQRLIRDHMPDAKLILQVGNSWPWETYSVQNVMASTAVRPVPADRNVVFYHQEFDLDTFKPSTEDMPVVARISSFINCLPTTADYLLFQRAADALPQFRFYSFGAGCPDGFKNGVRGVAAGIRGAMFVWHVKPGGDGFGHVIHNAFAIGRPVITRKSHYAGCLAENLMVDGETCIDLDSHTEAESWDIITRIGNSPDEWRAMARAASDRFKAVVDFDREEQDIRAFLGKLR